MRARALLGTDPADHPIPSHYFPLCNITSPTRFPNAGLAEKGSKGFPEQQDMYSRVFAMTAPRVLPNTTGTTD